MTFIISRLFLTYNQQTAYCLAVFRKAFIRELFHAHVASAQRIRNVNGIHIGIYFPCQNSLFF